MRERSHVVRVPVGCIERPTDKVVSLGTSVPDGRSIILFCLAGRTRIGSVPGCLYLGDCYVLVGAEQPLGHALRSYWPVCIWNNCRQTAHRTGENPAAGSNHRDRPAGRMGNTGDHVRVQQVQSCNRGGSDIKNTPAGLAGLSTADIVQTKSRATDW